MINQRSSGHTARPLKLNQEIADWKKKVETRLTGIFKDYSKRLPLTSSAMRQAVEILKEFTLRSASRRLRAFLVKVGYETTGRRPPRALIDVAASIELLQVYLLIHDDIIDRAQTRRGGPTVHRALYRRLNDFTGDRNRLANDLAMLIGDLAFSWSMHVIAESAWPAERRLKALVALLSTHEICVGGQYLDVLPPGASALTKRHVREVAARKTASYSFIGPLTVGAILGGAPPQTLKALQSYGRSAGLAFQWIDDLKDVTDAIQSDQLSSDVQERKITAVVLAARRQLNRIQRQRLDNLFLKTDDNQIAAWQRQRLIQQTDFKPKILSEARNFNARGIASLRSARTVDSHSIEKLSKLGQYILGLKSE